MDVGVRAIARRSTHDLEHRSVGTEHETPLRQTWGCHLFRRARPKTAHHDPSSLLLEPGHFPSLTLQAPELRGAEQRIGERASGAQLSGFVDREIRNAIARR